MPSTTGAGLVAPIQALRLVAALLVVLGHARHAALTATGSTGWLASWGNANFYAAGVDVFFVISGFIIHSSCHGAFGRPLAARRFLLRRLVRIALLYWLCTLAMAAAAWLLPAAVRGNCLHGAHLLASLLFLPATNCQGEPFPLLALGWTLNFEMLFYGLFAIGLSLPRRRGILVVVAAVASLALVGLVALPTGMPWAIWSQPLVLEFLLGLLIAQLRLQGLALRPGPAAVCIAIGVAGLMAGSTLGSDTPFWTLRPLCMGLPAGLVVAGCALLTDQGWPGRWRALLVAGGDASYALYLVHPFVIGLARLGRPAWQLLGPEALVVSTVAASLLAAWWVHRGLERPLTRHLNARIQAWLGSARLPATPTAWDGR